MRLAFFLMVCGGVLLGGCGHDTGELHPQQEHQLITGVTVEDLSYRKIAEVLETVGTVKSTQQNVLAAKTTAHIFAIHAKEGDRVRARQVMIELDSRPARSQLKSAQAGLRESHNAREEVEQAIQAATKSLAVARAQHRLAAATHRRYQALLERRSVAPQEYEEVAARYTVATAEVEHAQAVEASLVAKKQQVLARIEQAEAELAAAQLAVGDAQLTAPINGIVTAKPAAVGDLATPGTPLMTIEAERYYLDTAVAASAVSRLEPQQEVVVTLDALAERQTGTIREILPSVDSHSRTFTVKINLPGLPGLRSGLYAKAQFIIGRRDALVIPHSALVERGQLQGVFVLNPDAIATLRLVQVGKTLGAQVEILAGLEDGERIVVDGAGRVIDGSKVVASSKLAVREQ